MTELQEENVSLVGSIDPSRLDAPPQSLFWCAGRWVVSIAVLAALVAAPHVVSPYVLRILISIVITVLPVASLSLLLGLGGQISMGQAAFAGCGAYTYADLTTKLHWSPWIAMVCGVVLSYFIAWSLGRPILRLRGYYLGMATLAIGLIASAFFNSVDAVTGGFSGISAIPTPSFFGLHLDSARKIYFYVLIVVGVVFFCLKRLESGDYGRRLRTVRESELAARAFGIDVPALKAHVFAIASATAALGGCLYAQYVSFISPDSFTINSSINYMLAAVVGGLGSMWGGLLGSVYVVLLPEALKSYGTYELLISGIIIVIVIGVAPGGLVEIGQFIARRVRRLLSNGSTSHG